MTAKRGVLKLQDGEKPSSENIPLFLGDPVGTRKSDALRTPERIT